MNDEDKEARRVLLRGTDDVLRALEPSGLPKSGAHFRAVGEVGLALEAIFHVLQRHRDLRALLSPEHMTFLSYAREELEKSGYYTVPTRQEFDAL
jgi:hypothetical protein